MAQSKVIVMNFDTKRKAGLLAMCFVGLFMMGCVASQNGQNQTQNENLTMANPASVYCINNGGLSKIVTAADGSQSGLCMFPNGAQCEEWAYFYKTCSPTNQTITPTTSANLSDLNDSDFTVVDDSMPDLLTSEDTPGEPDNNLG